VLGGSIKADSSSERVHKEGKLFLKKHFHVVKTYPPSRRKNEGEGKKKENQRGYSSPEMVRRKIALYHEKKKEGRGIGKHNTNPSGVGDKRQGNTPEANFKKLREKKKERKIATGGPGMLSYKNGRQERLGLQGVRTLEDVGNERGGITLYKRRLIRRSYLGTIR